MSIRFKRRHGCRTTKDKDLFLAIKNIFGFKPKNINLYKLAFRHKSKAIEFPNGFKDSNERLEYLGDAVLSIAVADILFRAYPFKDEGFLTEMRSKIVSRSNLNKLGQKVGLNKLIEYESCAKNQFRSINGDAFEAFIGAIYIDRGYLYSLKIIKRIIDSYMDINDLETNILNYKSTIINWGQKEKKQVEFRIIDEQGSSHKKRYIVQVFIDGEAHKIGEDYSIKKAENRAAENTWINDILVAENEN